MKDDRADLAPARGAERPAGRTGGPVRMWVLCGIVGVLVLAVVAVLLASRVRSSRSSVSRSAGRTSVTGDARASAPASTASDAARPASYPGVARLQPDATGRIRIPLTDARPPRLPVDGVPEGWSLKEFSGNAVVSLVRDDGQTALRLTSARTSFALYRDVIVDLAATPWLTWSWKVTRLPSGGDVRSSATDDEAAQVYVIFPRWPAPLSQSDVLGYVWDTRAPVDTQLTSPKAANVRIIVLRSGDGGGAWRREARDVAADYAAAFGRKAPRVGKIALMIDSNDTRTEAEALFGELAFSPLPGPPGGDVPGRLPVGKPS